MLSGTAYGLQRLYERLVMALAIDAFPLLLLLILGAVPLLVFLLATYESLVVVVPTILLCFHTSRIGTLA